MLQKNSKVVLVFLLGMTLFFLNCDDNSTGTRDIPVDGVALNDYEAALNIGDTFQLVAIVSPEDATNKTVFWSSSAGGVATVSNAGLVTALSDGISMIKVHTEDGDFEAYCTITVAPNVINVTGISLDITSQSITIGETLQLTATVTPANATDKTVTWNSSNSDAVVVSENGLVTGVSGGTAIITATTNDGNYTATCEIIVGGVGVITEIMEKGFLKSPGKGAGVDLAIGPMGDLYMSLIAEDLSLDSKAIVEVWSYSGSWSQFGDRVAITDDESYATSVILDNNGEVFVAHEYFGDINDPRYECLCVASSTGGEYTYLGSGSGRLIKDGNTKLDGGTELAFKEDGTLMVATMDGGAGRVHYFDGSSWISYNGYKTNNNGTFWGGGIELKCFGNIPYISIRTGSGDGKTGVLVGNEINGVYGQWEWLANSYANSSSQGCSFQDERTNEASLAIDSKGNIYTAYKALYNGDWYIFTKMFDGSSWNTIGNWIIGNQNQVDVVVANDIVYAIIANYNGGIEVYRLNEDGNWKKEVDTERLDTSYNLDAVAGLNGEIFIGYECTGNNVGQVGVFQYTPYTD